MKRAALVLTLRLPPRWSDVLPRFGFTFPQVMRGSLGSPGDRIYRVRCYAPGEGYGGCVRSLAYHLSAPVLMQREGEHVARLVFPLRTHPADGVEFSTNGS